MSQAQQAESAEKTINKIVIDGCDATGLSIEVLSQTEALFYSIIELSDEHSRIKELATIGAMLIDFSASTIEDYNMQFKAIHQGGAL